MQSDELVTVNTVDDLRAELGAESVVEATVDRVPSDLSLTTIDGVENAIVENTTIRVRCTRPAAKMRALNRIDEDATVTDISIEDASLEPLFEEYTGNMDEVSGGDRTPAAEAAEATTPTTIGAEGD